MKKLFVLILFACLLNACSEQQPTEKMAESLAANDLFQVPKVLIGATLGGVPLPDHTIVRHMDASSVQLQLPEKIFIYAKNDSGDLYSANDVCYTCTCSGSSGCDVLYYQGNFACSECKGGSCTGKRTNCGNIQRSGITDGEFVFVDFSQGVQLVNNNTNTNRFYAATDLFFEIPEVQQAINELHKKYYGKVTINDEDIKNTRMVALNLYGVLVGYPLPQTASIQDAPVPVANVSCSCQSGDSGCKYKKAFGGVSRCESNGCTSCQMRVKDAQQ
jgi:hypothetical protein